MINKYLKCLSLIFLYSVIASSHTRAEWVNGTSGYVWSGPAMGQWLTLTENSASEPVQPTNWEMAFPFVTRLGVVYVLPDNMGPTYQCSTIWLYGEQQTENPFENAPTSVPGLFRMSHIDFVMRESVTGRLFYWRSDLLAEYQLEVLLMKLADMGRESDLRALLPTVPEPDEELARLYEDRFKNSMYGSSSDFLDATNALSAALTEYGDYMSKLASAKQNGTPLKITDPENGDRVYYLGYFMTEEEYAVYATLELSWSIAISTPLPGILKLF